MRDVVVSVFIALMITLALSLAGVYGLYKLRETTRQECTSGYMWSFKEEGCIPGYRPQQER